MWLRHYMCGSIIGWIFSISASTVTRCIRKYLPFLHKALSYLLPWPSIGERNFGAKHLSTGEKISIIIDCTEQAILKPGNKLKEQAHFSGKKKCHTMICLAACCPTGKIYYVSDSYNGAKNDPAVYNLPEVLLHKRLQYDEWICGDPAFAFISNHHPCITTSPPKPTISKEKAKLNAELIPIRLVIENVFGQMKKFQILRQQFRHNIKLHHLIFKTVACLINLKIKKTPLRSIID
eukprot:TRINITY_DN276_c0_g1_i3.p1 TRINITY_DN276_c0_g1~~TRINITY_DN276_c0_g1_i3.p1  ORF type:complete len:235 (-),score=19.71 TRINITY_DN276_c0_g1_i3:92-796(-)